MAKSDRKLQLAAWSLSLVASTVAFIAWGEGIRWRIGGVSTYKLFPLFGLLAFSIMWSHYIMGAVRRYMGASKEVLKDFFEITSMIVLLCILLHPGLLVWQLWRDGLGLPPLSYLNNYVANSARWAALLGSLSLIVFLSFELRRWFNKKKWWRYIEYASDVGMGLIFIHAFRLGGQLHSGWFRVVWWVYGISLVAALATIYAYKHKQKNEENS